MSNERIELITLPYDDGVNDDCVLVIAGAKLLHWEAGGELDVNELFRGKRVHKNCKATLTFDIIEIKKMHRNRIESKGVTDGK